MGRAALILLVGCARVSRGADTPSSTSDQAHLLIADCKLSSTKPSNGSQPKLASTCPIDVEGGTPQDARIADLEAKVEQLMQLIPPPAPPPQPVQPELVAFCNGCVNPQLRHAMGKIGRPSGQSWSVDAYSSRTIRSATDTWNGFSFNCGSNTGYKIAALTSETPSTTLSHGKFQYGFVCRPGGQVTFLTPGPACRADGSSHAYTTDGDAATGATATDVFAVKFNADGVLEYRVNGHVKSPACTTQNGNWPQPSAFPLHLMVDVYTPEVATYGLTGITWLSKDDP